MSCGFDKMEEIKFVTTGQNAAVKMNILPRLVFLFQTIPIVKETKQLDAWQRKSSKFVWRGEKQGLK